MPFPPDGSTPKVEGKREENRSPHVPDANWTRAGKRRQPFYGHKMPIVIDQDSGLIRTRIPTPPKVSESEVADDLVIGRVRTAVERTFSELKRGRYDLKRMRNTGLTRCRMHLDLAAIAYNLRRVTA